MFISRFKKKNFSLAPASFFSVHTPTSSPSLASAAPLDVPKLEPVPIPNAHQPVKPVKPLESAGYAISLKALIQDNAVQEEAHDLISMDGPKEDFQESAVLAHWNAHLKSIQSTDPMLYHVLSPIRLHVEGLRVVLEFASSASLKEFSNIKYDYLKSLRESLQNALVDIDETIVEGSHFAQIPITKDEIYKHMVQKNPLLETLRTRFDLDVFGG